MLRILVLAFCATVFVTASFERRALHKPGDAINVIVTGTSLFQDGEREKREVEQMPLNMDVEISSAHAISKLRLKRSPLVDAYVLDNGQKTQVNSIFDTQAVYEDREKRAAFIVRRSAANSYHMEGSLNHGEQMINMAPASRTKRHASDENVHEVISSDAFNINTDFVHRELKERVKRGVTFSTHYIEITFIADCEIYAQYLAKYKSDLFARQAMILHYTFTRTQIQCRFDSLKTRTLYFRINIVVTEFIILTDRTHCTFTETIKTTNDQVDADSSLTKCSAWLGYPVGNYTFKPTDHYMFFTGYDLTLDGDVRCIGQAYFKGLCQVTKPNIKSVSIVENHISPYITGHAASQQIGYVIGASYDGEAGVTCTDENYVMSRYMEIPTAKNVDAQRSYYFSSCSVNAMKRFLFGSSIQCTRVNRYSDEIVFGVQIPGQLLDADAQCRLEFGELSYFCRGSYMNEMNFDKMCYLGYCYDPVQYACTPIVFTEFTTCGNKKWCFKGRCISNPSAPTIPAGKTLVSYRHLY
ncbi:hypothetical protein SNE40_006266 [Patella caerulea]|uniref:Peptidase M12B domain-containing protein n=1 Tax=Patella caerulea TaxID=87958 RepID=A0AAN8K133_PATCE